MLPSTPFRRRSLVALGVAAALLVCSGSAIAKKGNLIIGTTDSVTTLDPAACYNYWCGNVILQNLGNTLVGYKADSTELVPELASALPTISDDGLTYTFKLRHGVTFQDGSKMTSKDVKFSLNRCRWIHDPEGASFLLDGIKSIDTPDPYTVVIHLKSPDITFTSKLAYIEATVLPSDAYPSPDGPLPANATPKEYDKYLKQDSFIGTGPYKLVDYRQNQSMMVEAWKGYWGKQPSNDKVLTRFFAKASQLVVALKSGGVDLAYRHLTPAQHKSLLKAKNIKIVKGTGAAIRYIVFNPYKKPADNAKVRQAIAATIDRKRIINDVLGGGGSPLYSMVPPTFKAGIPAFKSQYEGKSAKDFINHKIDLTLWYSRGHYGATETALAQTIARELDETGLFNVKLDSAEWAQFSANAWPGKKGQYGIFLLGWYPDYMDPDDYVAPFFYSKKSFLQMYDNPEMDKLLEEESTAKSPSSDARMETFAKIQKLAAKDVPTLPLYVINQYAYVRDNVTGVSKTMGPTQILHFGVIHRTDK